MKRYILIMACVLVLAGCGQKITLLPDLDGHVGEVTVTAKTGETVVLNEANQTVSGKEDVYVMTDEEVAKEFADVIEAQPEPTARFLLYFASDSVELTAQSKELFPDIIKSFKERKSTDVSVVGHADRLGDSKYNFALSLRRAKHITDMLIKMGVPAEYIETGSHGEENPLIPTPDNTSEPRNRRVEVLVR